jgi:hypothetical protein
VTFEADIGAELVPCPQTGPCLGPVRRVTLRTFHRPLQYLMPDGKRELSPHLLMAGETEIRVLLFQEICRPPCPMDPVAVVTSNGAQFVGPSPELKEFLLFLVTGQARVGSYLRVFFLKREDPGASLCLHVLGTGAMAGFTVFAPVGALWKGLVDIRMAVFTGFGTHISFLLLLALVLSEGRQADEGCRKDNGKNQYQQLFPLVHSGSPSFGRMIGFLPMNQDYNVYTFKNPCLPG